MIALLGSGYGPEKTALATTRKDIGSLISPKQPGNKTPIYACDNDVYNNRNDPEWWCREGEKRWLKMLDTISGEHLPLWAALPDVYGDWLRTLERGWHYREELLSRGIRVAIALQNGIGDWSEALALSPDAVFVGGSTEWKWKYAEEICAYFQPRGIWVHIARVSGYLKARESLRIGADSIDGTGWMRNPGRNLPELLQELDGTHSQMRLGL